MAHAWAAAKKTGGTDGGGSGPGADGGSGGGGEPSRFTVPLAKDTDGRAEAESDGGASASEPMDEDEASVASSQGDS